MVSSPLYAILLAILIRGSSRKVPILTYLEGKDTVFFDRSHWVNTWVISIVYESDHKITNKISFCECQWCRQSPNWPALMCKVLNCYIFTLCILFSSSTFPVLSLILLVLLSFSRYGNLPAAQRKLHDTLPLCFCARRCLSLWCNILRMFWPTNTGKADFLFPLFPACCVYVYYRTY